MGAVLVELKLHLMRPNSGNLLRCAALVFEKYNVPLFGKSCRVVQFFAGVETRKHFPLSNTQPAVPPKVQLVMILGNFLCLEE